MKKLFLPIIVLVIIQGCSTFQPQTERNYIAHLQAYSTLQSLALKIQDDLSPYEIELVQELDRDAIHIIKQVDNGKMNMLQATSLLKTIITTMEGILIND